VRNYRTKASYNKLWKLLIDESIKSICEYLQCDIGDIMEMVPENLVIK